MKAVAVVLWSITAFLAGCTQGSSVMVNSVRSPVADTLRNGDITSVYSTVDQNTADIYMTDLPPPALDPGGDLEGVSGRIVHFHIFLAPRAGSTPIESSACTVMIRHFVIAGGQIGIYSGGGFINPGSGRGWAGGGRIGSPQLTGTLQNATVRLTASTPGFSDRLGAATVEATIDARHDESQARRIGIRINDLLRRVEPVGGD